MSVWIFIWSRKHLKLFIHVKVHSHGAIFLSATAFIYIIWNGLNGCQCDCSHCKTAIWLKNAIALRKIAPCEQSLRVASIQQLFKNGYNLMCIQATPPPPLQDTDPAPFAHLPQLPVSILLKHILVFKTLKLYQWWYKNDLGIISCLIVNKSRKASYAQRFIEHPAGRSLVSVMCGEINRFCSHWSQW